MMTCRSDLDTFSMNEKLLPGILKQMKHSFLFLDKSIPWNCRAIRRLVQHHQCKKQCPGRIQKGNTLTSSPFFRIKRLLVLIMIHLSPWKHRARTFFCLLLTKSPAQNTSKNVYHFCSNVAGYIVRYTNTEWRLRVRRLL